MPTRFNKGTCRLARILLGTVACAASLQPWLRTPATEVVAAASVDSSPSPATASPGPGASAGPASPGPASPGPSASAGTASPGPSATVMAPSPAPSAHPSAAAAAAGIGAAVSPGPSGAVTTATNAVTAEPSAEDVRAGEKVYSANCTMCHGASGKGGMGPSLAGIGKHKSLDEAVAFIKSPSGAMPKLFPARISEAQVREVATYIRATFR